MPKGGKRVGAGRKAKIRPNLTANKKLAAEVLSMVHPPIHIKECTCQVCRWWEYLTAKDLRLRFDADRYLEDKLNGKAVQAHEDTILFDPSAPIRVVIEHIGKK